MDRSGHAIAGMSLTALCRLAGMMLVFAFCARAEESSSISAPDASTLSIIEVEVRFIEVAETHQSDPDPVSLSSSQAPFYQHGAAISNTLLPKGIITNFPIFLQSLKEKGKVNLMSAPKLTARSGQSAELNVVREITYPSEYKLQNYAWNKKSREMRLVSSNEIVEPPETLVTGVGIPSFTSRNVGVMLSVTPVLIDEGEVILLDIRTEICELADWVDYGSTMQFVDGEFKYIKMTQPVFHSRMVSSAVSMKNGQTLILGGLSTEDVSKEIHKTPFFGSIPLLGRLFRSEQTVRRKVNRFICITARKQDN